MPSPLRHFRILIFVLAVSFIAHAEDAKTFMWKATSANGNTVYLLGSIHLATEDFYPLAPEIEKAFADSKKLVVEANVLDPEKQGDMQKLAMQKAMFTDGRKLSGVLSKPTLDALNTWSANGGMPVAQLEPMRPWMVSMMITMVEFQKNGFKPELGIDAHFLKAAGKEKPILELESGEAQINLLSGFSDELQDKLLLHSLTETEELKPNIKKMADAWKNGDTKVIEDLMLKESLAKHPELKPFMVKLLDERNVPMAEKIDGYLKGKDIHFVVVGSGHLVGEKGVVALLQKKGYKVEQIQTAKK